MERVTHTWKRVPAAVRKPLIFIVGVAIVAAGLAMLVLPGPGWAAIFLGLAVLATEFAIAARARDWVIATFKAQLQRIKHKRK